MEGRSAHQLWAAASCHEISTMWRVRARVRVVLAQKVSGGVLEGATAEGRLDTCAQTRAGKDGCALAASRKDRRARVCMSVREAERASAALTLSSSSSSAANSSSSPSTLNSRRISRSTRSSPGGNVPSGARPSSPLESNDVNLRRGRRGGGGRLEAVGWRRLTDGIGLVYCARGADWRRCGCGTPRIAARRTAAERYGWGTSRGVTPAHAPCVAYLRLVKPHAGRWSQHRPAE